MRNLRRKINRYLIKESYICENVDKQFFSWSLTLTLLNIYLKQTDLRQIRKPFLSSKVTTFWNIMPRKLDGFPPQSVFV